MSIDKLISNCGKETCPLYSEFFNVKNAQSSYIVEQYQWAKRYYSNKQFRNSFGEFGAKLILIMESPPPKLNEYFYGDEGGLEKENGLFSCICQALIQAEGKPKNIDWSDTELALKYIKDKDFWLSWISDLGFFIVDASKCRLKISDALYSEKVSENRIRKAFYNCKDILKLQIQSLNPYRLAVGIAGVYDSGIVKSICDELEIANRFIPKRIKSPFRGNKDNFIKEIKNIWIKVREDFSLS